MYSQIAPNQRIAEKSDAYNYKERTIELFAQKCQKEK
jgi:hypothetical protein